MTHRDLLTIVLAAGKGTRMKSAVPKVLHAVAGRSMLGHVLSLADSAGQSRLAVVIGPSMDDVRAATLALAPSASVYIQPEQRGTADAVLAARQAIAAHRGDVIVLYADTPLIEPATIGRLLQALEDGAGIAVLGFQAKDPTGYGRLITGSGGSLEAIREEKDASAAERSITLCNSGVMAFRGDGLLDRLGRIGCDNAKGEYYLTDLVELARADGLAAAVVSCREDEVLGVNARDQLAAAEAIFQDRARRRAMEQGATLIAPQTVWFSYDTVVGRDVVIEPNVVLGLGVVIEDGAEIKSNCYLEGAHIGTGSRVGPFARLRPGAKLGAKVHIGNFVELKATVMGDGAKANHLSYLGNGVIGPRANIGAGTIFCNYDGFFKHTTEIGAGAFVGSNTSLVAPVKIGEGAYIGSGSVITKDVAADALALERASQDERPGWAAKFRQMMQRRKDKAGK
jgi:bifunctional UDP-N-acetylglucosamine pyrophosphorylase/glucosamine-1-phosphate N-acetyltransferase